MQKIFSCIWEKEGNVMGWIAIFVSIGIVAIARAIKCPKCKKGRWASYPNLKFPSSGVLFYNECMDYKYTGIILDKKDVGETDRIYTIYTQENGKIRVLAKSVRKANAKLAGFLENFNLAEIFIAKSQGMGKITGSLVINSFSEMRENLEALGSVFKLSALLNKLIKDESKDSKIFELLKEYLETMNNASNQKDDCKLETISLSFTFKLLEELGYKIEINNCLECGEKIREGNNFFNSEQGGIMCDKCCIKNRRGIKISANSIKILRIFFQNSLKSLIKLKTDKKDINNLKIIKQEFLNWIA